MTRKKFIKNMMALGYDRNDANDKAELVHLAGYTYADQWAREKAVYKFNAMLADMAQRARACAGEICKELVKAVEKMQPAMMAAARRVTAAMGAMSIYKLAPEDYVEEPAQQWTKENPSLEGLYTELVLADELDSHGGGGND